MNLESFNYPERHDKVKCYLQYGSVVLLPAGNREVPSLIETTKDQKYFIIQLIISKMVISIMD